MDVFTGRLNLVGPYRHAIAFACVFAAAVCAAVPWAPVVLKEPDTLWHITTGDWILAHRAVPMVDTFSFTMAGQPWVAQEWLSEVIMAVTYGWCGWTGLIILTGVAAGSVIGLMAFYVRLRTRLDLAVMLVLLGAACAAPHLLARPHVLALPLVALWTVGLVAARARASGPPLLLLPLMTVWANMHGGFMLGLGLAGALGVEAVFDPACVWRSSLLRWGAFLLAAIAAAAITPHGLDGLMFPFRLMTMHALAHIMEWQPSDFSELDGMVVSILLGLYAGLTGAVRLPKFRVLLLTGLIFATMQHVRYAQVFGVLAPLLLADPLGRAADRPGMFNIRMPDALPVCLMGLVLLVSVSIRTAIPVRRIDESTYAATALASVPAELRTKPVFNDYGFGGILIFNGIKPFVDGRADLYGDAFLDRYLNVVQLKRDSLDDLLCHFGIEWTMFGPEAVVPALLDRTPGWHRLYADEFAVIHVRDPKAERPTCSGD